ncbi:hypothetical protein ACLESD_27405 [Pyxidicoccus sp. 3LFB2]
MASLRSRSSRRARGAATVELALSLLILIPVVLYAIYAGELFLAATRAQEAEITAGWDMTAYRMHDYEFGYRRDGPYVSDTAADTQRAVAEAVPRRVRADLGRMDSFQRANTETGGRRFLLTEQRLEQLGCEPFNVQQHYPLLTFEGLPNGVREYLHRGSYMACRARVRFTSPYMPQRLREGTTSQVDLLHERLRNDGRGFTLCGLGGSLRGCDEDRGFIVLTDDWGLEDATESPVTTWWLADNFKYANVGSSVYHRAPEPVVDGHGFEGGTGAKAVRFTMDFLLDNARDYAYTSDFKFGFRNPSSEMQTFEVEGGAMDRAHLTPWDDDDMGFLGSQQVRRDRRHYLGHSEADYVHRHWP